LRRRLIEGNDCTARVGRARSRSGLGASLLLAWALAITPTAVWADSEGAAGLAKEEGIGAGSALATLVYAPVKLVYATGGLVAGGLAYLFSGGDSEVARVVFTPSLRGDYVVTTDHLRGEQRLEFLGREPAYDSAASTNVAAAPEDWSEGW